MVRRVLFLGSILVMLLPGVAQAQSYSVNQDVTLPGSWYVTSQTLTLYYTKTNGCYDIIKITGKWHRISTYARVNPVVRTGWFGVQCDHGGTVQSNPTYNPAVTWTPTSTYEANGTFTINLDLPPFELGPMPYALSGVTLEGNVYYRNMYKGTGCTALFLNSGPGCD